MKNNNANKYEKASKNVKQKRNKKSFLRFFFIYTNLQLETSEYSIMLSEKKPLHNPNRIIAPGMKIYELNGKTFNETLNLFENRINGFYLNPFKKLIKKPILMKKRKIKRNSDLGFIMISISFTVLDLLSQYYEGAVSSDWNHFSKFIEQYLPVFDKNCKAKGILYHNDDLSKKVHSNKKTLIWILWYGYRHGIIHNGKVMSYAQYNYFQKNLYQEKSWTDFNKDLRYEFWLSPVKFHEKVKKGFSLFMNDLRKSNSSMPIYNNFLFKFEGDFGYG